MPVKAALIIITTLACSCCSREIDMLPHLIYPMEHVGFDYWLSAPIIVVAALSRVEVLGDDVRVTASPSLSVKLARITINIESVLKGDVGFGNAVAYFFTVSSPPVSFQPIFSPAAGDKKILFLRREDNRLRLFVDVFELSIPVHSGNHAGDKYDSTSVGERVLFTILTPGADVDVPSFVNNLERDYLKTWAFASPKYAVKLLTSLLHYGDKSVRDRACLILSYQYPGQAQCLTSLLKDPTSAARTEAVQIFSRNKVDEPNIIRRLEKEPLSFGNSDTLDFAEQGLELLSTHPNHRIAALACARIRESFPLQVTPSCEAANRRIHQ